MNWLKQIFKSKAKKPEKDESEIEVDQYEIELICLEKIPQLNLQNIMISTFDLSVTQLRIPPAETSVKDEKGEDVKKQFPEIIFYLKIPSKIENSELESISLANALIPDFHLLASKCKSIDMENVIADMGGKKFFKKLVYDLILFTPDTLMKLNMQYLEYRKEIEQIKLKYLHDKERLQEEYKESLEGMERPYLEKEKHLKQALDKANAENFDLTFNLPAQRNASLKNAIKRMNLT